MPIPAPTPENATPQTPPLDLGALLGRVDQKKARLDALRPLQPEAVASLQAAHDLELLVASNQIEGNTLTLDETALVLEKGVTIGGKPLKDHIEAVNLNAAWTLVRGLAQRRAPMDKATALELHRIILTRLDDENAGRYRAVRVFIKGSRHVPPNPLRVPELMQAAWERFAQAGPDDADIVHRHPVIKLADLHYQIGAIHPFVDSNGRTARLLLNLGLIRHGYPPAQITLEERLQYINALEATGAGSPDAFRRYVIHAVDASLDRYLAALQSL